MFKASENDEMSFEDIILVFFFNVLHRLVLLLQPRRFRVMGRIGFDLPIIGCANNRQEEDECSSSPSRELARERPRSEREDLNPPVQKVVLIQPFKELFSSEINANHKAEFPELLLQKNEF